MRRGNRIWGIVISGIGVFYLIEGFSLPPAAIGDPLGPLTFPTILGISLVSCGAYLAFWPGPPATQTVLARASFQQILILFALLIVYSASISWVGYPISTFLFVLIAAFLMGERSWAKGLLISAVFTMGIFFLFVRVLTIPLPWGFLKNLGLQ